MKKAFLILFLWFSGLIIAVYGAWYILYKIGMPEVIMCVAMIGVMIFFVYLLTALRDKMIDHSPEYYAQGTIKFKKIVQQVKCQEKLLLFGIIVS